MNRSFIVGEAGRVREPAFVCCRVVSREVIAILGRRLRPSRALAGAAARHAVDMASRRYLSHTTPEGHGPAEQMAAFRPRSWGQSIAAGRTSLDRLVQAMLDDRGVPGKPHRRHLLGLGHYARHSHVGAALASRHGRSYLVVCTACRLPVASIAI
jgi:hypothetical protein